MNSVDIWLALQGFCWDWQLSMTLLWKREQKRVGFVLLITRTVACFTHFFQVKEHNQLNYLNCRQKWGKQHSEPGQKTECLFILVTNAVEFKDVLQHFGLIPSECLSVYELQHVPGDVKRGLPLLLQHPSGKESGGKSSAVSIKGWNLKLHGATVKRGLASTGTLPNTCEAPWRQSPRGGGDKFLVLWNSPSTATAEIIISSKNVKARRACKGGVWKTIIVIVEYCSSSWTPD